MPDSAGSLGSLFVELTANSVSLIKGMKEAKDAVHEGAESISKQIEGIKESFKSLAETLLLAEVIHKVVEFTKETMEANKALAILSKETGVAVQALAGLQFAADKADVGEELGRGMVLFGKSLREAQVPGSAMALLFQQIGVNANQDLLPAFEQVSDKFAGWKDGVDKMGVATELFGTRNAKFVNLLNEGSEGLKEQSALFNQLSGVDVKHAAEVAEEFDAALKDLKESFKGLATIFYEQFLPALSEITDDMAKHNTVYREAAEVLGTVLTGAIKIAMVSLQGLLALGNVIGAGILSMGAIWLDFWKSAIDQILTLVNGIVNTTLASINFVIRQINFLKGMLPSKLGGGAGIQEIQFKANLTNPFGETMKDYAGMMRDARESLLDDTAKLFTEGSAVIKKGGTEIKKTMDAVNVAQNNALAEQIKKLTEDYAATRANAMKDIAGLHGNDATGKYFGYQAEVAAAQKQIDELKKISDAKIKLTEDQQKKMNDLLSLYGKKQQAAQEAQNILVIDTMQKMNDDLLTIAEAYGGKQTSIYKAMFAASKAFAIAEATVKIAQGIAEAAGAPWPLNLFAMAQVVAATASIVSSIQAVKLEFAGGKAAGGPVGAGQMYLTGERGPELFVPQSNGSIIPNNQLTGGRTSVVIHNYTDAQPQVTERQDGDQKVIEVMMRRMKRDISGEIREDRGDINRAMKSSFSLRRGSR